MGYKQNPDVKFREEFDGTGILFHPATGKTYLLNQTAILIWKLLIQERSENELIATLEDLYGSSKSFASDVTAILNKLQTNHFIRNNK